MVYKNSPWLIGLLYFAILFFPAMALFGGYLAYDGYLSKESEHVWTLAFGALFFGFLSPIGFKLSKFVRLAYRLNDEGIEIFRGEVSEFHPWSHTMRIRDSSSLQLFYLYGDNGKTIAMVDYMMPGFSEFSTFIKARVAER